MADVLPTVQGDSGPTQVVPVLLVKPDGTPYEAPSLSSIADYLAANTPALNWVSLGEDAELFRHSPDTADAAAPDFIFSVSNHPLDNGPPGEVNYWNHVAHLGWNWKGGDREDETKAGYGLSWESKWNLGGVFAHEFHLQGKDTGGTSHRWLSLAMPVDGGGGSRLTSNVDIVNFSTSAGDQRVQIRTADNIVDLNNGIVILVAENDYAFLRQKNAADSGYVDLLRLGSDNRVLIGGPLWAGGATPTTGSYANTFARLQPSSLPVNGTAFNVSLPTVAGSVRAALFSGSSTGNVSVEIENNDTANQFGHARLSLLVNGAGTGDPKLQFTVNGVTNWHVGIDNSVNDSFVWSTGNLGAADKMVLDTSGNLSAALPRSTTAALEAIGNAINTVNKLAGKVVINTTTGAIVTASGTTAGAVWQALDGTTAHTPA